MDVHSNITVRLGTADDAAFVVQCNMQLARETENLPLEIGTVRRGVEAVLTDRAKGFYLIGEIEGRLAGQLLITYEWSDWRDGVFWWIQSVYTIPELRHRGVFQALYSQVERLARQEGTVCGLRLYVASSNVEAQKIYGLCSLHQTGYLLFERDDVLPRSLG
jgi:ribosomal protein S18 acetylase RimI-like enzyme